MQGNLTPTTGPFAIPLHAYTDTLFIAADPNLAPTVENVEGEPKESTPWQTMHYLYNKIATAASEESIRSVFPHDLQTVFRNGDQGGLAHRTHCRAHQSYSLENIRTS